MAIRPILQYPDPLLKQVAEPVEAVTDELRILAADMAETMYDAPGVGLAAPQIGILKRLIVIDCAPGEERDLIVAVNPEILESEGERFEEEGCLSVPGYWAGVHRKGYVRVRYSDLEGRTVERQAEGLLAVAFQHEIDHLDGILFVDHLSALKKGLFRKKYKKILEAKKQP